MWVEPLPLERLNWLIHLQHVRGEISKCKDLIKSEIDNSGERNEFAFYKQGVIYREEGRIQDALNSFQICIKLNPQNSENIKQVGRCLYEMRRYRLALEGYLDAERVARNPDWQISYRIGQCYQRLGDAKNAKEYAQKAVQVGKSEQAYALLVKILLAEGDLRAASAICNVAIDACPDSVDMLTESGLIYLKIGQSQLAFERFGSALALDPNHTKALLGLGCITQSHEEHDVALSKYKIAVTYDPNSVALWNNIGMCFYSKQKHIAAISCLKRALWLSPTNWRLLFNLGLVHLSIYQPASAFNFLCAAVNLRPDVPNSFIALGCSLMELNDVENAQRAFKQALNLNSDDAIILINNIMAALKLSQFDQAQQISKQYTNFIKNNKKTMSREILAIGERLNDILQSTGEIKTQDNDKKNIENDDENMEKSKEIGESQTLRELQPDEV